MGVVRFRDGKNGYANGDIGRIETQQAFLKAVIEQMLQIKNVTKINEFAKVFQKNVTTDLSFQNILWFAQQAIFGGLKVEDVNFVTMPYKGVSAWSRYYHQPLSYVVPVADELLELVNNELSPFTQVFTLSDLDIMYVNADGSIGSTTGHVEDSQAAKAPNTGSSGGSTSGGSTNKPSTGGETTAPGTGGETTDPGAGGGTTDPGTGGETGGGTTDPGTGGETGGGTTDPGTGGETGGGTTAPGTGGETGGGTTDPGTGGETGGGTTDPGTGGGTTAPTDPSTQTPTEPTDGQGQ